MPATMIKEKLMDEINLIPSKKLPEVFNFLHSYRLGVELSGKDDLSHSWDLEIHDRLSAVKSGALTGIDYDVAMQTLNKKLNL